MCMAPLLGLRVSDGEGSPGSVVQGPWHRDVPDARCEGDVAAAPAAPQERTASAVSRGHVQEGISGLL